MSLFHVGRKVGWGLIAGLLVGNLLFGARLYSQEVAGGERKNAYDNIALFTKVIEQIRENYVDEDKVSYDELIEGALQGMLQSLDPHSQFLDADMYSDMKDDTSGQFGGLGIVISIKDGLLTIVAPMEDTPGWRAGLMPGDRIMEIDGKTTEGMALTEAVKILRGAPGTKVSIKVLRPKNQEIKAVELERAEIKVSSVKDARMIDHEVGYVRVTQFNEPTAEALKKDVESLRSDGMKALVLDLRNNPGGLLTSAIEVSQQFLPRSEVIVSTQGRNAKQQQVFRARGRDHFLDFPIAVLVNGGSASASEIVAGALRDHKRAILVGEKTFGKGSVQSVLPMDGGTAIRLTTAKYYTPSKQVIHDRGIEPDIVVPMAPDDWRKLLMRSAQPEGAEPVDESGQPIGEVVDVQLERAVDVLKGIMTFTGRDMKDGRITMR